MNELFVLMQKRGCGPYFTYGVSKENMILKGKHKLGFSLVSLVKYLARLKLRKWPQDETSLEVSNLDCSH